MPRAGVFLPIVPSTHSLPQGHRPQAPTENGQGARLGAVPTLGRPVGGGRPVLFAGGGWQGASFMTGLGDTLALSGWS